MGKLPYIPNKKLYAAVMGACSYIRSTGYFNKAISYYADKYDVDEDDIAYYVRIAQSRGQKVSNAKKPARHYLWFAVEYSLGNERNGGAYFDASDAQYAVKKGISAETVQSRMSARDDYKSEYAPVHWFGRVEGFETKEEAEAKCDEWMETPYEPEVPKELIEYAKNYCHR